MSGALKNVNTNGGEKNSQTNSATANVTSLGQPTPDPVVAQAPSETTVTDHANANKQAHNTDSEKLTNNNTDAFRTMPSPFFSLTTRSTAVHHATAITKRGQGSVNGSNKQTVLSDEESNDGPNTSDSSESPAANTRSRKVSEKSHDSFEENASRRRRRSKRDDVVNFEEQKRLNLEEAKQEDGISNVSDVLSDSQHGLISTRPGRACKRKHSESLGQSRRNRKISNQSNSEGKTPKPTVENNEQESPHDVDSETSPRRSKRMQREMNARSTLHNTLSVDNVEEPTPATAETASATAKPTSANAETTGTAEFTSAITLTNSATAEPSSASNTIENNETARPGSAPSVFIQNPYLQVKRVIMDTDIQLPRVPSIPPLPPTATTLNAFKTLLTLRKDLQLQTNRLKVAQHDHHQQQSDQNGSTTTSDKNPLADRLLLVSDTKQTPHEQFRNSVPYQLLLNRFKGLFMWPGFLSIVNPRFVKPSQSQTPGETNKTSKSKRKKKGCGIKV